MKIQAFILHYIQDVMQSYYDAVLETSVTWLETDMILDQSGELQFWLLSESNGFFLDMSSPCCVFIFKSQILCLSKIASAVSQSYDEGTLTKEEGKILLIRPVELCRQFAGWEQ